MEFPLRHQSFGAGLVLHGLYFFGKALAVELRGHRPEDDLAKEAVRRNNLAGEHVLLREAVQPDLRVRPAAVVVRNEDRAVRMIP